MLDFLLFCAVSLVGLLVIFRTVSRINSRRDPRLRSKQRKSRLPSPPLRSRTANADTNIPWERKLKSRRRAKTGWIPRDGNAREAGREIGGMVYVGRGPRTDPYGQPDNAFIDPNMKVTLRGGDFEGYGLHYWPSYSTIEARSRATYLDWLSSGRSDTRYNVGYVFLYFYGLERRVFVDAADSEERTEIVTEVRRLLELFGDNHSIRRYFSTFIDAVGLLGSSGATEPVFENLGYELPTNLRLALGRMAMSGTPLTSDWLLSWYVCIPETRLRTPAKRAFSEFRAYFRHLFDQDYPHGLKIRVPKRYLRLVYHASSGNFSADLTTELGNVPDVSRLSAPLRVAQDIADRTADGLDRYSRYLGRKPEGKGTIEAHALLPEVLWPLFLCPEKEELREWVTKHIESGGLVPVENLIERLEGAPPEKIGRRQQIGVADALARLGIGMAPDPRFAMRKIQLAEPVVLFQLPEDTFTIERPSEGYLSAILSLSFGTLVAQADGRVEAAERVHIAGQIDANKSVTKAERARLHANFSWLIAVPPNIAMLRSRLRNATESSRSALCQLAVSIAGADGAIEPQEIQTIERLYIALGLDRERVYSDLHALASKPEPVTVRPAGGGPPDFAIPSAPSEKPTGTVTLDTTRISEILADTDRVSQVLGDIFGEDDDQNVELIDDVESEGDKWFNGLDAPHRAVASVLITRPRWTEEEIAASADEHQLMAAGALETINEWAFEKFGDALIEEYDGYEINEDVAQRMMH